MMKMVATVGAIRCARHNSNCHHQVHLAIKRERGREMHALYMLLAFVRAIFFYTCV